MGGVEAPEEGSVVHPVAAGDRLSKQQMIHKCCLGEKGVKAICKTRKNINNDNHNYLLKLSFYLIKIEQGNPWTMHSGSEMDFINIRIICEKKIFFIWRLEVRLPGSSST